MEEDVCWIRHTFDHSGRTTYLFFSEDNWLRSYHAARRSVERMVEAVRKYNSGSLRKSDFVTVKRNVLADIEVKVSVQQRFDFTDDEVELLVHEILGPRSGIFKLESSEQLTTNEALDKYRPRVTVEHLIHSLKRVTGLKPLRVWNESSIRGSMMLALLSETAIAMAGYGMKPHTETRMGKGRPETKEVRPSTGSMVWSSGHLTVTRIVRSGIRKEAHFSNWDAISREVFYNISSDHRSERAVCT